MSADAADLFAECLVVPPSRLVINDLASEPVIELFRANSRSAESRSGDLRAQMAGNYTGERRMLELYERHGTHVMQAAIERSLRDSEIRMRHALSALPAGSYHYEDVLEDPDGNPSIRIALTMTIRPGEVHFDYTGTAAQLWFPMNAVYGVTLSGVYYVLRAVTDPTIPMNEGCLRPVTVHVPEGTLLNPRRPAPVSGGNVETSTRNADVVFGALAKAAPERVPAQSGGTMSNVMIGGTRTDGSTWAFYETNGCGMGARPGMDGIDAIQCHMTNTLNTPIEAIERDYPLRVDRYEIAEKTGGCGRYRGGCGLVRSLRLTQGTARVSLLAERHVRAPQGAQGGGEGTCGVHVFTPSRQQARTVPAKTTLAMHPGDAIEVHTPGGGGYGLGEGEDNTNGTERGVGVAGSGAGEAPGA
jgi:N-methylhydantoinase B